MDIEWKIVVRPNIQLFTHISFFLRRLMGSLHIKLVIPRFSPCVTVFNMEFSFVI
jgi:hypothetical protein